MEVALAEPQHFGGREPPPPSWDGSDPSALLPMYEKNVMLWQFETECEERKRGVRLLRSLSGIARSVADSMSFEEIACTSGVENLLKTLRSHFEPHLELSLPRAFEKAVYGAPRSSKESIQEYLIRVERAFVVLAKEGLNLDEAAKGYVAYRHASLTEAQDLQFSTWNKGQFDWKTVTSCLRRLEKVVPKKSSGAFVQMEGDDDADPSPLAETFVQENEDASEDDQYILVEEGDLNRIYEEEEAQLALATYQEVRKALGAQQKGRQYYGGGRSGTRGPSGKGKGRGDGVSRRRIHIEELKLRTRCGRCGLVGHWARECANSPDQRGRQRMAAAAAALKSAGTSTASSKGGSSVAPSQSWYVATGTSAGSLPSVECCFGFSCRGDARSFYGNEVAGFLSHDSLNLEESEDTEVSSPIDASNSVEVFDFVDCPKSSDGQTTAYFVGLTTSPALAVVDTAAQDGLIGLGALERLKMQLSEQGLQVAWTNKQARAHGVGGAAKVIGIAAIPLGIGGVSGILEATVVEGEVPLLLPVRMLKDLGAIIDLTSLCIHFQKLQRTLPLTVLPSGHVAMQVLEFGEQGFQFSAVGNSPFSESDFRKPCGPSTEAQRVMLPNSSAAFPAVSYGSFGCASTPPDACTFGRRSGRCTNGSWHPSQFEESSEALAPTFGQSSATPTASWIRGVGALVASTGLRDRRVVSDVFRAARRAHQACRQNDPIETKGGTSEESRGMRSHGREVDKWGKSVCSMGGVHGLPQQVEDPNDPKGCKAGEKGESQEREEREPSSRGERACEQSGDGCTQGGVREAERNGADVPQNAEGTPGGAQPFGRRVEDAHESRAEDSKNGDTEPARSPGNSRSDDDRVRQYGVGVSIQARDEGLSRQRDVYVCQEPAGQSEGDSTAGSASTGDQQGKSEHSSRSSSPSRGGMGRLDGGDRFDSRSQSSGEEDRAEGAVNIEAEATWVRLSRSGGVKTEVERLQGAAFFQVQQVLLEFEEGVYEAEVGELQSEDESCLVKLSRSARGWLEEVCEDVEETSLPKKVKTKLRAAEKEMKENHAWQVDVSEVFSPPRVTKEARRQKMRAGHAIDLQTGYDLRTEKDLKRMWRALEEDDPELTVCSPPCGPFCQIQSLNFPRMPTEKVMRIVGEGLQHLRTAAQVCKRQYKRGKIFVLEHPRGSKAWVEEEIEELKWLPGVFVCRFDMCQFGMRVGQDLNKKPTTVITNSAEVAKELSRVCSGGHVHESLMGGKAAKAAEYPPALCRAMLRGLRRHLRKQNVVEKPEVQELVVLASEDKGEDASSSSSESSTNSSSSDESSSESQPARPQGRRRLQPLPAEAAVTPEDQAKLRRMHVNLGHPSKPSFLRFLRAGRVREELVRWVAKEFSCSTCASTTLPKAPRPAIIPRCYTPSVALGLDVFFIPDELNRQTIPVLNLLDLGTNYQMVEILSSKEPMHIWKTLWRVWGRTFGLPQYITVDEGREFRGGFSRVCAEAGIIVFSAAARAPWQQGKVERHGGLMKTMIEKAREETPPTNREDLEQLLHACEAAKNRFSNRSGYSPTQRQIGQWPRMPSSLLSDEAIDPALQSQGSMDEFEKMMEMRRIAQDAFMKLACKEAAARALQARPRVMPTYKAGDLVYVYRTLRRQKALRHEIGPRVGHFRAKWVGPGKVLATEGSVVWVNMLGELWRVAAEQMRLATTEEKLGAEIISEECEEMQERLKRNSHRAGYRDITGQPRPPDVEQTAEASEEQAGQVQALEQPSPVSAEGLRRGQPRQRIQINIDDAPVQRPRAENAQLLRRVSIATEAEPEGEVGSTAESADPQREETEEPGGPAIEDSFEDQLDREVEESAVNAAAHNQRLDGVPTRDYAALRRSVRGQWGRNTADPYFAEFFFLEEHEKEGQEEKPQRDYWVFDQHREVLQRHHVAWRKALFNPLQAEGSPVPLRALGKGRKTFRKLSDGTQEELKDEWSLFTAKEERLSWWRGVTEFSVDGHFLAAKQGDSQKKKRGEGEVFPHEISPEEWPAWRVQDQEEFSKIVESGALRVLSVEESRRVRKELEAAGKLNRIIPSRMVRRYKPGEGPGAPRTLKSRFCLRGDKDPDILSLSRFSPTVTTSNLQVIFQVAANKRFRGVVGDLKAAFTQSKPLLRSEGPLYCRSSHGSMPGLHEEQLAEVVLGCYGLVDAPLNWRQTLTEFVQKELGYRQSSLDPCTYLYFDVDPSSASKEASLQGVISIEVDDLLMFGGKLHEKKMQQLQQRFKFGKLKEINAQGVDFNGRRLRQEGETFLIDMQAFVEERLQVIKMSAARKKERKADITEEERSQVRSVCGALNWAGREGRPDAAAAASMFSSLMSSMKVEDVIDLNRVVEQLKADSKLALRIQPIEESRMRWGVISDASWANAKNGKTQAGHMLITFDKALLEGAKAVTNVLHWRSGKLQRTVNSTLAAETQSLARGVGDLLWMMIVYMELVKPEFHVREWRKYIGRLGYNAFTKVVETQELEDALALVDAKSLYDVLAHETTGGSDKRNALDVQVLREELSEMRGQIRWVEHLEMPADCLTKRHGKVTTLKKLLNEGVFGITEESATLSSRLSDRKEHGYNRR